jgi:hypothetical protein
MSEDRQFVDAQRELLEESKARRITLPSAFFQQQAKKGNDGVKIYRVNRDISPLILNLGIVSR